MSRDFTTKPRPDQPGRCPSIDPLDTLQCTRRIHDDDQCQAGGIAWRKGSPRIESDRERANRLQEDVEEYDAILRRQGDLLTRTVNALRGNPPPLTSWSHHDIPELAAEKVSEVERLTAERDALRSLLTEFVDDEPCWLDHHGYCQAHSHFDEGECHMARARDALADAEAGGDR